MALLKQLVLCSHFKSEKTLTQSIRGREMIMDNLRRFHNNLEPLQLADLNHSESFQTVNDRLVEFNKYYLFEEQWLNCVMYIIIKEYFPENFTLESEGIHDCVELMTFEYIFKIREAICKFVPIHLYHAILTFFHDTIYGPGQNVPSDILSWQTYISFKITGIDLSRTIAFFKSILWENDFTEFLRFMLQSESPDERKQYFNENRHFLGFDRNAVHFEWNFDGYLPENDAESLIDALGEGQIYSEHILDKIELTESIDEYLSSMVGSRHIYRRFQRYLYRKFGVQMEECINNCESYIESRDLDNPFGLEVLQSFDDFEPWSAFRIVATKDLPYLIKMDMLSKLVRSELVPLNLIEPMNNSQLKPVLQKLIEEDLPFFELIITEYSHLVNLENLNLSSTSSKYFKGPRRDLLVATQFPRNNPFALLKYLEFDLSSRDFPDIKGKFNLDVAYRIDNDIPYVDNIEFGSFQSLFVTTLTFREILRSLKNKDVNREFGLTSPNDFAESEEQIESYPVISMQAFLNDPNSVI